MAKPKLLFISMLGVPGKHDRELFDDLPDGGDDWRWVKYRLTEWGVADKIDYHSVCITEGDSLPEPKGFDAVMIGGSVHSIHEGAPWQQELQAWLAEWRKTGLPVLGICGGHQMMSVMAGAPVEKRANGPVGRSAPIDLTEAGRTHLLFDGFDDAPWFQFGNSDHVSAAPVQSVVLAVSDDSPALALDHGGGWLSVQFHPEFLHDTMARTWLWDAPENIANYRPLPEAPRLLVNFLRYAGLIQ